MGGHGGEVGAGRLFLAVSLPERTRLLLAGHLAASPALPGRVVPPENWHLTLRFLGATPAPAAARLDDELAAAPLGAPFEIRFGALGAFPRPARATVTWLGLRAGEAALRELAAAVEAAVRRAGLPPEDRPFSPHLTLSRSRSPQDARPLIDAFRPLDLAMPVQEVVLYRSHLGSGPPRYDAVRTFALT